MCLGNDRQERLRRAPGHIPLDDGLNDPSAEAAQDVPTNAGDIGTPAKLRSRQNGGQLLPIQPPSGEPGDAPSRRSGLSHPLFDQTARRKFAKGTLSTPRSLTLSETNPRHSRAAARSCGLWATRQPRIQGGLS